MFERFTEKMRRTVFFARYEASHLGSKEITSEHLLLGLLRDDKAVLRHLLLNIDYESVRNEIVARVQPGVLAQRSGLGLRGMLPALYLRGLLLPGVLRHYLDPETRPLSAFFKPSKISNLPCITTVVLFPFGSLSGL